MTVMRVRLPNSLAAERAYAVRCLFQDLFELEVELLFEDRARSSIELPEAGPAILELSDAFFREACPQWLRPGSVPSSHILTFPAERLDGRLQRILGKERSLPLIAHDLPSATSDLITPMPDGSLRCDLDIFGSAFFMLSRYEELCSSLRDDHGRFPASASLAARARFLERPIVNEYAELLWSMMSKLWPQLRRREGVYRRRVTHDVDRLRNVHGVPAPLLLRHVVGDLVKRRSPPRALSRARSWARARAHPERDPYWNFDDVMDASERAGERSLFHFILAHCGTFDADYFANDPDVGVAFRRIAARGHMIGLHGSYLSAGDSGRLAREVATLRECCAAQGVPMERICLRQHYLRWDSRRMPGLLDATGVDLDSTLGFAEAIGFRTGACFEHRLFDFGARRASDVREAPLHIMDSSLTHPGYMGLTVEDASDRIAQMRETVRRHAGMLVVLWHQDAFVEQPWQWELFREALR